MALHLEGLLHGAPHRRDGLADDLGLVRQLGLEVVAIAEDASVLRSGSRVWQHLGPAVDALVEFVVGVDRLVEGQFVGDDE